MSQQRGASAHGRARKSPFGAPPPPGDQSHTGTMADAVRRCRWIAVDIGAASFILFFVAPPGDKRRLIFGFDAEFPGQAGLVAFHGPAIALDERLLHETHARAFALFAGVTRLKPLSGGKGLTISKRELECLALTANGLTSEEIAAQLGLSVHTANQYLTNSTQKLNAVNRMHAVAKALRLGLID